MLDKSNKIRSHFSFHHLGLMAWSQGIWSTAFAAKLVDIVSNATIHGNLSLVWELSDFYVTYCFLNISPTKHYITCKTFFIWLNFWSQISMFQKKLEDEVVDKNKHLYMQNKKVEYILLPNDTLLILYHFWLDPP